MSDSKPRIAILIAQHPAINHAVILREVQRLRKSLEVYTASIREPDRPFDQLSQEEREEAQATYYVKSQGFMGAVGALLASPGRALSGLLYAIGLGGSWFRNIGYWGEALIVGRWMMKNRLKHLHVHYRSEEHTSELQS